MAVQKQVGAFMDARPTAAGNDLTGKERRCAKRDASGNFLLAQNGDISAGVIQEGKAAGYSSTVMTGGMAKVVASQSFTAGQRMQVGADGSVIPGVTNAVGVARNSGVSGDLAEVVLDQV